MNFFLWIEKHFGILFLLGAFMAFIAPLWSHAVLTLFLPILMSILLLVYLKIDLLHIFHHLANVRLMVMIQTSLFVVIPIIFFIIASLFSYPLASGVLLLTALPAGVSSPALTDLLKGNTAMAMSIMILSSFLAPFTIPLLFKFLTSQELALDYFGMFQTLLLMIFIPLVLSIFIKRFFLFTVERLKPSFGGISVLLIMLMLYGAIGPQRDLIFQNPFDMILQLIILYVIFIALHLVGYFLFPKRKKPDRIAFAVTRSYMNNGLGIVLAAKYFSPEILIFLVLSDIPWVTLIAPFKKILK